MDRLDPASEQEVNLILDKLEISKDMQVRGPSYLWSTFLIFALSAAAVVFSAYHLLRGDGPSSATSLAILSSLLLATTAAFLWRKKKLSQAEANRQTAFSQQLEDFSAAILRRHGLRMRCSDGGRRLELHVLAVCFELQTRASPQPPTKSIVSLRNIALEEDVIGFENEEKIKN